MKFVFVKYFQRWKEGSVLFTVKARMGNPEPERMEYYHILMWAYNMFIILDGHTVTLPCSMFIRYDLM